MKAKIKTIKSPQELLHIYETKDRAALHVASAAHIPLVYISSAGWALPSTQTHTHTHTHTRTRTSTIKHTHTHVQVEQCVKPTMRRLECTARAQSHFVTHLLIRSCFRLRLDPMSWCSIYKQRQSASFASSIIIEAGTMGRRGKEGQKMRGIRFLLFHCFNIQPFIHGKDSMEEEQID